MSTIASSLTFGDLIIRVAEAMGWASYDPTSTASIAAVPSDAQILNRCERAINDSVAELAKRYDWTYLSPLVEINLDASGKDPACVNQQNNVYAFPIYGPCAIRGWTWQDSAGTFSGRAQDTSYERVALQNPTRVGPPLLAALYPAPIPTDATKARAEFHLIVWPRPDQTYVLRSRVKRFVRPMQDHSELHALGPMHDSLIEKWAIARLKRTPDNVQMAADELDASIRAEGELKPQTLGTAMPGLPLPGRSKIYPGVAPLSLVGDTPYSAYSGGV